jgi:hypothetical protein
MILLFLLIFFALVQVLYRNAYVCGRSVVASAGASASAAVSFVLRRMEEKRLVQISKIGAD